MKPKDWWTETRVTLLKVRWAEGYSASHIATELGTTRGAVIGKVHRLHLLPPKTHQSPPPRPRARKRPVPHVPSPPIAPAPKFTFVEPTSPVHIRDLERHHCRWMPGEPATLMYCGKTKSEGSPYCTKHTRAAYNR